MTSENKTKILIVDDVELNRLILREILKDKYDIVEADDGDVCIDMLRCDKSIDLVLLDIIMPHVDGFAVLSAMREDKSISRPVIVVTSDNLTDIEIKALNSGALDFLEKPYNPDIVRSRVDNIVTRKILEAKNMKAELSTVNERFSAMIGLVPDGIAVGSITSGGNILIEYTNEYFKNFFLIDKEKSDNLENGKYTIDDICKIVYDDDKESVINAFRNIVSGSDFSSFEFRVVPENDIKWIRLSMTLIPSSDGSVRCYALITDITADRERESQITSAFDELKYMTSHDSLTQLFNRESFCEKTDQLIKNNPGCKYTLVISDIKNFKVINDLFGSDSGDKVLIRIAEKVKMLAESNGTYGRLGSDKFAICIPSSECDAQKIIDDMDDWINNSGIISYNIKIYLGICDIDDERNVPADRICDRAVMALKSAKRDYLKRFMYYDNNMRRSIMDEESILNEMESALAKGQFKLCYQPIFSISSGKPVSAEALVRWIHPTRGIIPPNKFIPIFENNKFITNLDKYVLEEACKYQRKRLDEGKKLIPISVNFSRLDCYLPGICEDVLALIKKYGLTTKMIKIEITESAYTEDKEQIISVAEKLHNYGFSILMDDFGSGYSSLNILKEVKFDILKIDKTFVDDMKDSDMGGAIVSSVVRMARLIGVDVIAEGVEDQYQIDFLRGIGCDIIQGYYYSKPLFEEEFSATLDKYIGMTDDESVIVFQNNISVDSAWGARENMNTVFDGLIGALGLYELSRDGVLEIIRVNDAYYDLFGVTPNSVYSNLSNGFSKLTEDSRNSLLESCSRAKYKNEISCCEIRKYHEDGHPMWISCRIKYIGKNNDRDMFYILANDITERKHDDISRQLNEYAEVFRTFFNAIFEFNTTKRTVTVLYSDETLDFDSGSKFDSDDFRKAFIKRSLPKDYTEEFLKHKTDFDRTDNLYIDKWNLKGRNGEIHPYERRLIKIKGCDDNIYLSCIVNVSREKEEIV